MKTIVVRTWRQLINSIAKCMQAQNNVGLWWRGHSDSKWQLVPAVYRKSYQSSEQTTYNLFMNRGKSRRYPAPASDDFVAWLFLMQHYRLRTRLLDWTRSPLIALYFAVAEVDSGIESVALWGLHPGKLNHHQKGCICESVILARAEVVKPIIKEAFEYWKSPESQKILAIETEEFDVRHMVQMSAFTIHGISNPLDQLDGSEKFLVKIEIPVQDIDTFKQGLSMFGVDESMLFPDLEHLANELNRSSFTK